MGPEPDVVASLLDTMSSSSVLENMAPPLRIGLFLGGLAFLTTALVSLTAFTRIVIVLSFVRRALTTQEIPPNPVVLGLALFLTAFVMGPTLDEITREALTPYFAEEIAGSEALKRGVSAMHGFMLRQVRTDDLVVMIDIAEISNPETPAETPLRVLVPAFIISELKTSFIMGFFVYVPFLLIDLVVSTLLMSLGMMMMPPMMISLPLKILLFVLVDGWQLVIRSLSTSFG